MSKLTITDADLKGLKDKVVIITGGSSGIGLETVTKFLQVGAKVVNGDLNPPPSGAENADLTFIPVDVTSWTQLSALFEKTVELHGRVDHVFANAGVGPSMNYLGENFDESGKLLEPEHRTIDINLKAVINTVYLAFYYMKKQETGGSVVMTASCSSFQRFRPVDYTLSKHGVLGYMRGLVPITFPHLPLRVNVVAPDWTASGIVNPDFVQAIESAGSLCQSPEVVARSVGLLMSDGERHGQMIYSYGGEFQEIEDLLLENVKKISGNGPSADHVAGLYFDSLAG